jgi:hypothetical protein
MERDKEANVTRKWEIYEILKNNNGELRKDVYEVLNYATAEDLREGIIEFQLSKNGLKKII